MKQAIFVTTIMDRNLHRPIPTKSRFRRFTTMLSQNDIQDDDIYSINEEAFDFVPNTQTMNETIQNIEREIEEIISCTPFEQQSKV